MFFEMELEDFIVVNLCSDLGVDWSNSHSISKVVRLIYKVKMIVNNLLLLQNNVTNLKILKRLQKLIHGNYTHFTHASTCPQLMVIQCGSLPHNSTTLNFIWLMR